MFNRFLKFTYKLFVLAPIAAYAANPIAAGLYLYYNYALLSTGALFYLVFWILTLFASAYKSDDKWAKTWVSRFLSMTFFKLGDCFLMKSLIVKAC